jgi:hypothetical protein
MEIRKFGLELSDYTEVDKWVVGHKSSGYAVEPYPEYALLAFHEGEPIAMMGIKGQQNVGIIDWLITNPLSGLKLRAKAIDELHAALEAYAKNCGMHILLAWTDHNSLVKHFVKQGWSVPEMTFLVKDLRG